MWLLVLVFLRLFTLLAAVISFCYGNIGLAAIFAVVFTIATPFHAYLQASVSGG